MDAVFWIMKTLSIYRYTRYLAAKSMDTEAVNKCVHLLHMHPEHNFLKHRYFVAEMMYHLVAASY